MFWKWFNRKVGDSALLFTGHFVEVKAFYVVEFDQVPCVTFIGDIDVSKAFKFIENAFRWDIAKTYQHNFFDHEDQEMKFNNTIFLLNDCRMIELANNYCQVLHLPDHFSWANKLVKDLAQFKQIVEPVKENRVIGFARQTDN
jgi:hypothetical protein